MSIIFPTLLPFYSLPFPISQSPVSSNQLTVNSVALYFRAPFSLVIHSLLSL